MGNVDVLCRIVICSDESHRWCNGQRARLECAMTIGWRVSTIQIQLRALV